MSNLTTKRIERLAKESGMRPKRPQPIELTDEPGILSAEAIETIHDWEDVDGDTLRDECLRGELIGVD